MLGVRNEVEPPFSRSLLRRRGPLIDLEKSTVETHSLSSTGFLLFVYVWVDWQGRGKVSKKEERRFVWGEF